MKSLSACSVLVIASTLVAQTVSPPEFADPATWEGSGLQALRPFSRYQQIYEPTAFAPRPPAAIRGLELGVLDARILTKASLRLSVRVALAAKGTRSDRPDPVFDKNVDLTTRRTMIANRVIDLPRFAGLDHVPLPFDANGAYVYDRARHGHGLVVEVLVGDTQGLFKITTGGYSHERLARGSVAGYGEACLGTAHGPCGDPDTAIAGEEYVVCAKPPSARAVGFVLLGLDDVEVAIPGAGGCVLRVAPSMVRPARQDRASGLWVFGWKIPDDPRLTRATFVTQFLFVDGRLNAAGVAATNGLAHEIGAGRHAPVSGASLVASSPLPRDPASFTRADDARPGEGVVTVFR